jgi:two-component system, response regulator YesN
MDMPVFKMLVVDDEALARYAFRTLISRHFSEIEVVGEAESGIQAVEMAQELKPDIIAMDIKMPGINGIEASEQILKELPDTNVLILTAYDNFHYVQKALDIGVKGYLLKPFKKEEVVGKIRKILEGIDEEKGRDNIREEVENKVRVIRPFIEKELVAAMIGGKPDIDEFRSYMNFLQEKIDAGYFMLILYGQYHAASINDSVRNHIFRDRVRAVLEKHLPLMRKCIFGQSMGNMIVVFFPCEGEFIPNSIVNESLVIAQEIKRRIKVISGIDTAVGVGAPYRNVGELIHSYNEANTAVRLAAEKNGVIHYSRQQVPMGKDTPLYPLQLENELLEALRIRNADRAVDLLKELVKELSRHHTDMRILREYVSQFVTVLKRTLLQLGVGIEPLTAVGSLADMAQFAEPEELLLWCRNSTITMIELVEPQKQSRDSGKIKKVHEFVGRNFAREITLEMAAEEVGLSPQYLSKVFKEETGMNFIEYVTEKRIQRACFLLREGTGNVKEVSHMVGYSDVNYFCRIFKKVTGVTPGQYKDSTSM